MARITDRRKIKEGRGTGTGADYKPWIQARELGSIGTESVIQDWKHGRSIQCLSQGEARVYYILRWQDDVLDIQEQYPLELELTRGIARRLRLPHPHDQHTHMTTDFLVTYKNPDGTRYLKAYSIKPNKSHLTDYALKNFAIEQAYWGINGIHIEIIFSDNLNKILASNIQQCVQYYNIKTVQSKIDLLKHLIARKIIQPDMETNYLNFPLLAAQYLDNPNQTQILLDQYEKIFLKKTNERNSL